MLRDLKHLGGPDFNLLVTTRLELPDALNLDLGELPSSALRKFRLQRPSLERLQDEEWDLAVEHLGGHPKALEILAGYLQDHPERVRTLVKRFEKVSEHIAGQLSREDQDRGRKLLIKEVLADVPEDRRPTFDRLCLLRAPLPTEELLDLLEAEGIETADEDLTWLRQRGLLARVAPSALLGGDMVHRLLAVPWKDALAERERGEVEQAWHRRVAEHLVQPGKPLPNFGLAAQHLAAAGDRAGAMKVYNRWALQLRDGHAYRASEQVAREGLQRFGKPLEPPEKVAAAELWILVHYALDALGDPGGAGQALAEANELLRNVQSKDADFYRAGVAMLQGDRLRTEGNVQLAVRAYESAVQGFEASGKDRERAIALGQLARLKAQAGNVQEALRLHKEQLQTYETLGDVRERAVTLGDIARLKAKAGDLSGARTLREEILETYDQLGDLEGVANTNFYLAQLDLTDEKPQDALPRLMESWKINLHLGRVDGIGFVGKLLGPILAANGLKDEARQVLTQSEAAFRKLGWEAQADQVKALMDGL